MFTKEKFEIQITGLLERIYRIKQLIAAHEVIARNSVRITYQSFFGTLQRTAFNRLILIELFNILDQKMNGVTMTKIVENVGSDEIRKQFKLKIEEWENKIIKLQVIRDKYIAHFDDLDIYDLQDTNPDCKMDYAKIYHLVNAIEEFLVLISSQPRPGVKKSMQEFADFDTSIKELNEILQITRLPISESLR